MKWIKLSKRINYAIISLVILSSCTVKWVTDYDETLATSIQEIAKHTDAFYLNMLETTNKDDNTRNYQNFAEGYAEIEAEINNIKLRNEVKSLNENSIKICGIVLEMWIDYKKEHKDGTTISDGIIKLNKSYMQDAFKAMLIAEEGKKFEKPIKE